MPTRGEEQYPETGWSTGQMAKIGPMRGGDPGREYRELEGVKKRKETQASENVPQRFPELSSEEWQGYFGKAWEIYGHGASKIDPSRTSPDGFIIEKGHQQIPDLSKDFDTFEIPKQGDEGWSGRFLFMKPRRQEPLTSEAEGRGRVA